MSIVRSIEERTQEIGREIYDRAVQGERKDVSAQVMEWSMRDERLKVQLFRFVDVLPMLKTARDVSAHIREYFTSNGQMLPGFARWGLSLTSSSGLASRAVAAIVENRISGMARRFIAGSNVREAEEAILRLRRQKMAFTMDILGEVAVSEVEAENYQNQYLNLIRDLSKLAERWETIPLLDTAAGRPIPKVNVSVKLSSLYSQWEPAAPEETAAAVKYRLRPILRLARELGAFINIDMEHYAIKSLTLKIFREILMEPEFRDWPDVGIAIQAYLRDSEEDVHSLIAWARERKTPVTVRLVKGAYWDYETVIARERRWPVPVFTEKHETDKSYEKITNILIESYPRIQTALGSHNIRSIAHGLARAEALSLPKGAVEVQMLYGMADAEKRAIVEMGQRLRVYTPYGELIPGMAYLVRRLLENTSNESFLRQGFAERMPIEFLLKNPAETRPGPARPDKYEKAFANEPERDFSRAENIDRMRHALERVRGQFDRRWPLVVGGKEVFTEDHIVSVNPARPSEVVGRTASATTKEAEMAVEAAKKAFPAWRDTPAEDRAHYLFRAAEIMRQERDELAAWEVFEAGKGWREADADICETIDYLNYYGQEMIRLGRPRRLGPVPGETNDYFYQPKGIAAIIPPWNFPMAIPAGMTTAAIVTGNTAILKPAVQTPIVAAKFVDVMRRAGLPEGVLNYVPGPGPLIGEYLVTHPDIDIIAFTGSRAVGVRINQLAAEVRPGQDRLKRVVAEMGGKNAVIIDSDADMDEAVMGTIVSAFSYQGQKCSAASRVIVLEPVYDLFLSRLVEAARSLRIGPVDDPSNFMGAVIDEKAREKILRYIEIGKSEARLVLETDVSRLGDGYFIGPTIFADAPPDAVIAQEEIFGPVIAVIRARDFEHAIEIAAGTSYALTGGVYSRSPANIDRARREFRVGNLYINRKTTGAIVARQPFGGLKMSGIGSKAGGPDYLIQFMEPRVVTENTLRRGFAPEEPAGQEPW
ncbi:MAG: L-glutamate gamma-semialdehyde dehydrogenase [Armatimonadetes bacterium]|nr:L-glutamate gamma-semialdehyde dehydrogenase [Armatimonadota bacterium]